MPSPRGSLAVPNARRRVTFSQQIGTVGLLVLLTVAFVPSYFIYKGFTKDIDFATQELYGIQYLRPLEELLENIPLHQAAARLYRRGETERRAELRTIAIRIDEALESLRKVTVRLEEALQLTGEGLATRKREHLRWETLKREWDTLKAGLASQSAEQSDELHAHLTSDVRTLIAHVGDTSNLILDPDLDSYYLMDAVLIALPQTQERLAELERLAQDAKGSLSDKQRMQFAVAAALLKESDVERIAGDLRTALNEDPNFHRASPGLQQNLPPAGAEYANANQALLEDLQTIGAAPVSTVNEVAAAASRARATSFRLWQTGAHELEVLLESRIRDLAGTRRWALFLTALAIVISGGIA